MARLIVRNIDDQIVEALRRRAAEHGRSAEAEHREILREVLLSREAEGVVRHLLSMPDVGRDEDFEAPREPARRADP